MPENLLSPVTVALLSNDVVRVEKPPHHIHRRLHYSPGTGTVGCTVLVVVI